MGKINGCLKCLFIVFNALFAIFGCIQIYKMLTASIGYAYVASIINHEVLAVGRLVLIFSWVFSISVLGISCLGIFAAYSEKTIALKIFAGFMAVGMIIMLIFGIVVAFERDQIRNEYTKPSMQDENTRTLVEYFSNLSMGVCFGFSVIALLGLVISVVMIQQIRSPDSTGGSSIAMHVY